MTEFTSKTVQSYPISIYLAGSYDDTVRACREFCFDVGLCVTVTPAEFVYTGGAESGVRVGLVNYPRFPTEPEKLTETAKKLGQFLARELHQWSVLIEGPTETIWLNRRTDAP